MVCKLTLLFLVTFGAKGVPFGLLPVSLTRNTSFHIGTHLTIFHHHLIESMLRIRCKIIMRIKSSPVVNVM